MCLSCSSEQRSEKFQKVSVTRCAPDAGAAADGNHVDPQTEISSISVKNILLLALHCSDYVGGWGRGECYLSAVPLQDLQGCS